MSGRRHPLFKRFHFFFWKSHQINKHEKLAHSIAPVFSSSSQPKKISKAYLDVGFCLNSLPLSLILLSPSLRTVKDFVIRDNPSSGLLMLQVKLSLIVLLLLFVSTTDSTESDISDEISQFSFAFILDKLLIINFSTVN